MTYMDAYGNQAGSGLPIRTAADVERESYASCRIVNNHIPLQGEVWMRGDKWKVSIEGPDWLIGAIANGSDGLKLTSYGGTVGSGRTSAIYEQTIRTQDNDTAKADQTLAERLAFDALCALAGSGVCTPEEGFLKYPAGLPRAIKDLAAERDTAHQDLRLVEAQRDTLIEELEQSNERLKTLEQSIRDAFGMPDVFDLQSAVQNLKTDCRRFDWMEREHPDICEMKDGSITIAFTEQPQIRAASYREAVDAGIAVRP